MRFNDARFMHKLSFFLWYEQSDWKIKPIFHFTGYFKSGLIPFPKLFHDKGPYHIEISTLIGSANQWTGFYMILNSVMSRLNQKSDKIVQNFFPVMHIPFRIAILFAQRITLCNPRT